MDSGMVRAALDRAAFFVGQLFGNGACLDGGGQTGNRSGCQIVQCADSAVDGAALEGGTVFEFIECPGCYAPGVGQRADGVENDGVSLLSVS